MIALMKATRSLKLKRSRYNLSFDSSLKLQVCNQWIVSRVIVFLLKLFVQASTTVIAKKAQDDSSSEDNSDESSDEEPPKKIQPKKVRESLFDF